MWPPENNTWGGYLQRPLKEKNNFVMEQYLFKKYSIYIRTYILDLSKVWMQDFSLWLC